MKAKKNVIIITALLLMAPLSFAFAHTGDSDGVSQHDVLMRQMMGDPAFEAMEAIEEQMMGAENHERMEELMDKMFAGILTAAEQNEMIDVMRDTRIGPGATNMMMRMMFPWVAQGGGFGTMTDWNMMGGLSGFSIVWWVTVILVWTVLMLAIIALWRWIKRK